MAEPSIGQMDPADTASEFNQHDFHIRQSLANVRTGIPVKIIAVHGGGLGPAPTVDVQPLVNQLDGQGNKTSHGTIYGIPVARNQGGGNAIINDPKTGDIGIIAVQDRDISSVKAKKGIANPGSFRQHDLADGVYHAAIINPAIPKQYVMFTDSGIVVADTNGNKLTLGPSGFVMDGNLQVNGDIHSTGTMKVDGDVLAKGIVAAKSGDAAQVRLLTHTHAHGAPPDPGT